MQMEGGEGEETPWEPPRPQQHQQHWHLSWPLRPRSSSLALRAFSFSFSCFLSSLCSLRHFAFFLLSIPLLCVSSTSALKARKRIMRAPIARRNEDQKNP
jgi:hypothetical protein